MINQQPHPTEQIYNEQADAGNQITQAKTLAQAEHRRILLMFGANWCLWCHRLDRLFHTDPAVSRLLNERYLLVYIDIGRYNKNLDLVQKWGSDLNVVGVPALAILDEQGSLVKFQETGSLEDGQGHSAEKVLNFLNKYAGH